MSVFFSCGFFIDLGVIFVIFFLTEKMTDAGLMGCNPMQEQGDTDEEMSGSLRFLMVKNREMSMSTQVLFPFFVCDLIFLYLIDRLLI